MISSSLRAPAKRNVDYAINWNIIMVVTVTTTTTTTDDDSDDDGEYGKMKGILMKLLYLINEMLQSIAACIGQHTHNHVFTALTADVEGAYVDDGLHRQTQYAR